MATSSAGLTSEQQAIFRELQSRRNSLAPDQQSIIDEIGRRLGAGSNGPSADTMPEFHAAPPPSGGFWSSLVNAVNPIPGLLDYIQHGPPAKQGIQALSHMDPSELPMPAGYSPDLLQQAGAPGVTAAGQAGEGNIAGAAGTLAGGYGLPLAAGKLAPEEGGTFSRILDLRKNPEFQRAAINLLPKGKEINMVRDMLTGTPPAPKVIPPPPLGRVINPVQNTPINPDLLTPPRVEFPEQPSPRVVAPPPIGRTINPVVEPKPAQVVPPPGVTFKPLPTRTVPQAPAPVFRTPFAIPPVEFTPGAAAQPGSSLAQPGPSLKPGEIATPEHSAAKNVSTAITNKVQNISEYLQSIGATKEGLAKMTPEQLKMVADAAHEFGKGKGAAVPKTGYKGLEGDTLRMVLDRLK